jgi:hypothetical protein
MRRRFLAAMAMAAAMLMAAPVKVSRATLNNLERRFDERIERHNIEDPFYLLGATRGVYLENYGAVFTAEVNLVMGPSINPFRPRLSKEDIDKLRQRKLGRMDDIRKVMRDMMVTSATVLNEVPENEQIVVGVNLFHHSWENTAGLPGQIVMQAKRKALADFEAGRLNLEGLNAAIREQTN